MKIKSKTLKMIICYVASLVLFCAANLGFLAILKTNQNDFVLASGQNMLEVSIDNSNFDNNTRTSYPFSPSSYDAYNYNDKVSSSSAAKNVSAGVINLENDKYSSKFSNAVRGNNLDKYVLMIDSTEEVDDETVLNTANFGYRTSSAIKMNANSHYMVSVDVFTLTNAGIGSVYLYNEDGTVFSKIENINSYNQWTPHTFFVSTADEALNLKLGMYLKGAGIVLFDNISCYQINSNQMTVLKNSMNSNVYTYENEVNNLVKEFIIESNSFKNLSSSEKFALNGAGGLGDTSLLQTVVNTDGTRNTALMMEIAEDNKSYMQYSTGDNFLSIEQNLLYKLNITLKTENLSGNANLQLIQTGVNKEDAINSEVLKITSNTGSSSNVNNNYQTYSFYINGHPTEDATFKLVFGLGDESTETSGKLFISHIALTKTNYSAYSSASTGTTAEKVDLTANETYSSSSIYFDNANFNAIQIADYNNPWPATPTSWSVATGTGTQKYGVINPSISDLSSLGLTNPINPFASNENDNNNVLMMYNASNDTLSYTSATKSLEANSYHCFAAKVQTQHATAKVSVVATVNGSEVELSSLNVSTDAQAWETVSLYLHTGSQDLDVALKVTLTTTEGYGYAYLDDTTFDYLTAPTQAEFENKLNSEPISTISVVDLNNMFRGNSSDQWTIPAYFTGDTNSGVTYGSITVNGNDLTTKVVANAEYISKFMGIGTDNVIGIRSTQDTFFTLKSSLGFDLTANEHYKLIVKVYTQNIGSNNSSVENANLGAQIKLSSFDEKFTQIVSDNEWTEYVFFINPSDDVTTYVELSLGNADYSCKGDVFFGGLSLESIEEADFNNATASSNIKILSTPAEATTDNSTNETTDDLTDSSSNNQWIYMIPSLLFAVSIIIAVVWVMARKIKWKKPVKKSKNAYDRNRTVSKQVYMRKATVVRENKLRELAKQLEELNAERAKYEDEYKQDLTKLRELKIKRANPQEISKLEKDMKKNQKLSASIGMSTNKVQNEIEYVKTDAYMNDLMKKISLEPTNKIEETEQK